MVYALILAAGNGSRMKMNIKKQFIKIYNKPLFIYSVDKFLKIKNIDKIYICFNKDDENIKEIIKFKINYKKYIDNNKIVLIFNGGKERYNSVYNSLNYIYDNNKINQNDKILIHDSARPNFSNEDTNKVISLLKKYNAITLASKSIDTLKTINEKFNNKMIKEIKNTLNREYIYNIKTPQGFNLNILYDSYNKFIKNKIKNITDDIMIIEYFSNEKSYILETNKYNLKITTKDDIDIIKNFLKK